MAKKKTSAKAAARPAKKTAKAKPAGKKPAAKKAGKSAPKQKSLPRPKVTGDEDLDMLFKEDYHARQIFAFLRVHTVRELEQLEAKDIIKQLSRPLEESVERIRRKLAEKNRYLTGDQQFMLEQRQ